jgi:glutamyl-tRNA synthetase
MVLLRGDGTPTYMLAVVVDDHDMGITHVIRGDDHLTNAGRQLMLYTALGWTPPAFAHIPLIHGPDGAKLSKRHGAMSVQDYREMGYLPEAICNYLLRLGWSHGDDEIISRARAIEWFDLGAVGKSPSRFDFAKLESLNGHYIREAEDARLLDLTAAALAGRLGRPPAAGERDRLARATPLLKTRAKTVPDLAEQAWFCVAPRPLALDDKAARLLNGEARRLLWDLHGRLERLPEWSIESLEAALAGFAAAREVKLGKLAQPLRAALTGRTASPGIYEVMTVLGRDESLCRIADQSLG